MKRIIEKIVKKYLNNFPDEYERLSDFLGYLDCHEDSEITDWNNFEGHIVASGFVYSKKEKEFLVLYHKDMKMYVYPGGHIDNTDSDPESATRRELSEETGLNTLEEYILDNDRLIPLDIDTHIIKKNERLDLPAHYHFDFRYLYFIDKEEDINIDSNESRDYKWVNIEEFSKTTNCEKIIPKIRKIIERL